MKQDDHPSHNMPAATQQYAGNVLPIRIPANDNNAGVNDSAGNLTGGMSDDEIDRSWNSLRDSMRPKPTLVPDPK